MTKQNRTVETREGKKRQPRVKPPVVEALTDELADLAAKFPGGPVAGVGDGVIENQATLLGDARFQTAQRQALGAHIGQAQGNRHLQRIVQRTLDRRALSIISYAQDTSIPAAERAVNVVRRIIQTYYSSQASLVADIVYNSAEMGLDTSCATFPDAQGTITVGDYFLNHTTRRGLARRVLQVDHELEHIRQQRRGMGGPQRSHLREFLAFAREAVASEAPGTGTMSPLMRSTLIDAALRHYCNMNDAQRSAQATARDRLLEARERYQRQIRAGRRTPPPTCSG